MIILYDNKIDYNRQKVKINYTKYVIINNINQIIKNG